MPSIIAMPPETSLATIPKMAQQNSVSNFDDAKLIGIGTFDVPYSTEWLADLFERNPMVLDRWNVLMSFDLPGPTSDLTKKLNHLFTKQLIHLKFNALHSLECIRFRLYVLSVDDGFPQREVSTLSSVLLQLDTSERSWIGEKVVDPISIGWEEVSSDEPDQTTLFAMFNSLPSPNPKPHTHTVHDDVYEDLSTGRIQGSRTVPYEYQRRSAALMLQREIAPELSVAPHMKKRTAPDGKEYYISKGNSKSPAISIHSNPIYHEDPRGGILAEEMGTGKTLTCLALILASKYHPAYMPTDEEVVPRPPLREVPTLVDICAKTILTKSVPWKDERLQVPWVIQNHITRASEELKYDVYQVQRTKVSKRADLSGGEKMDIQLGSGTIVVVPPNLMNQWEDEIKKHCLVEHLNYITLMDNDKIPPVKELLKHDIVLITRRRFDREVNENQDGKGRRKSAGVPLICTCPYILATRIRACVCPKEEDFYRSPLMQVHWKRLIVDEGHSMSSTKSNSIAVAGRLRVQNRWIVTGTPSSGLYAAPESEWEYAKAEATDLKKMGNIMQHFLKIQGCSSWPATLTKDNASVAWSMLKRIMVRHRISDIEKEVKLPPMRQDLVLLKPGLFEKLTMNLFLGSLAANAVTSERQDQDYMFHPSQRASLNAFVTNLRQGTVHWTSFSVSDLESTLKISNRYLEEAKAGQKKLCTKDDIVLLEKAIEVNNDALQSPEWRTFSKYHEMGYFISGLPEHIAETWSISKESDRTQHTFLGGTQALQMQKYLTNHVLELEENPFGLCAEGINELKQYEAYIDSPKKDKKDKKNVKRVASDNNVDKFRMERVAKGINDELQGLAEGISGNRPPLNGILKRPEAKSTIDLLPTDSPLRQAKVSGTASVKISYLLDKIVVLAPEEKILVFFESDAIGFYMAEALDILAIPYLLYTRTLDVHQKAAYLVTFNTTPKFRVFLMDVNQAAHGINLYSASRVFFINPLWQPPSVEAQALKRAHRIGQTRTVYVETLVLADTVEELIFNRRQGMSEADFRSQKLMMDDPELRNLLSNASFVDTKSKDNYAKLANGQLLFGEGKTGTAPENPLVDIVKLGNVRSVIPARQLQQNSNNVFMPVGSDILSPSRKVQVVDLVQSDLAISRLKIGKQRFKRSTPLRPRPAPEKRKVAFVSLLDDDQEISSASDAAAFSTQAQNFGEGSSVDQITRPKKRVRFSLSPQVLDDDSEYTSSRPNGHVAASADVMDLDAQSSNNNDDDKDHDLPIISDLTGLGGESDPEIIESDGSEYLDEQEEEDDDGFEIVEDVPTASSSSSRRNRQSFMTMGTDWQEISSDDDYAPSSTEPLRRARVVINESDDDMPTPTRRTERKTYVISSDEEEDEVDGETELQTSTRRAERRQVIIDSDDDNAEVVNRNDDEEMIEHIVEGESSMAEEEDDDEYDEDYREG